MYIYFSYTKTQKRWLQQCRPKNLAALNYLPCTSKEYIILFCVYTYGLNIYIYIYIFFFSFSSFPTSTRCSSLPSDGPHTLHFFPLQASIPPPAAEPSPWPAPTTPIDLFVLRPYLSAISFFLYSVSQSFSVSNTKTPDRRSWLSSVLKRLIII